jgi:excisionase family DNA binding protein
MNDRTSPVGDLGPTHPPEVRDRCRLMLRVKQVADRLNLSQSKVYELIEAGELPHHRFGGAIRVSEEQIAEYLEETKHDRHEREPRTQLRRRLPLRHLRL